jgi:type IV pilus assembly protein PilV
MKIHKQRGVGLIEVIVTVLVLSIGLLGVAALLTSGLRASEGSLVRSKANELAYGITERMYNRAGDARCGRYDITLAAGSPGTATPVNADRDWWLGRLAAELPGGDGSIACIPAPGANCAAQGIAACTITVQWDDQRAGGGATEQFQVVMRP